MILNTEYLKALLRVINPENNDILLKRILTKQQYNIFNLRYDKNYDEAMPVVEIANYLNITKQAVNQILNSIYKRLINYCKKIEPNHQMSKPIPSRKEQLIKSIKELERLPHEYTTEGKPEKTFIPDGVNQKSYYNYLKSKVIKINNKLNKSIPLSKKEQQTIDEYNEIQAQLDKIEQTIEISDYAKQLIETIHIIHRLPKQTKNAEFVFSDGKNQRAYYDSLQNCINNISKITRPLTRLEKQKMLEYQEIIKVLKIYKRYSTRKLTREQKKQEIIETIKRTHHNLRVTKNIEDKFSNGAIQKFYYYNLRSIVMNLQEESKNRKLTEKEIQLINDLKEIDDAINKYCEKQDYNQINIFNDKVKQLIKIINKLQKRPIAARDNKKHEGVKFSDGTDSRNFLDRLLFLNSRINQKIQNNQPLTEREILIQKSYIKLINILSFYPIHKKDNKKEIENLCSTFNIDIENNKSLYNKSAGELYSKIMYLIDNNIEITDDNGQVNSIMYISDINMKRTYNITLEELLNTYINGKENIKEITKKKI